ncbi:hypothetical protein QJQ45_010835 [Haematococcus lacustris]|nr:hypothetical protein QJQ45_010835 [Haematococcus lacustris]
MQMQPTSGSGNIAPALDGDPESTLFAEDDVADDFPEPVSAPSDRLVDADFFNSFEDDFDEDDMAVTR